MEAGVSRRSGPTAWRVAVTAMIGVTALVASLSCASVTGGRRRGAPATPLVNAVASPGCAIKNPRAASGAKVTIKSGGEQRWFLLTTPPANPSDPSPTPKPLVVSLPGFAIAPGISAAITRLDALGGRRDFITATPAARGKPHNWQDVPANSSNPDIKFVNEVITRVEAEHCVDSSRVYVVGMSSGGLLASALVCESSKRLAAVATVAGVEIPPGCHPARRVPMLVIHGTADPLLHFRGGVGLEAAHQLAEAAEKKIAVPTTTTAPATTVATGSRPILAIDGPGVPSTIAVWAALNGCDSKPRDERLDDTTTIRRYHCPASADVTFFVTAGAGSTWPGSVTGSELDGLTGTTSLSFDATRVIWTFFAAHQLG